MKAFKSYLIKSRHAVNRQIFFFKKTNKLSNKCQNTNHYPQNRIGQMQLFKSYKRNSERGRSKISKWEYVK